MPFVMRLLSQLCFAFTLDFLDLFSLWLSFVLLKVTIPLFCSASCIHCHACPCHAHSQHQHHPISPFSILSYFAFSPTLFHSYLIWHISASLTLWLGHTYKAPVALFVFCLLMHRANEVHQCVIWALGEFFYILNHVLKKKTNLHFIAYTVAIYKTSDRKRCQMCRLSPM